MQLSLWNFISELGKFKLNYHILDGTADIKGIQLLNASERKTDKSPYILYLSYDNNNPKYPVLLHNDDQIKIYDTDATQVFNLVLKIFADFNIWENDLQRLGKGGNLQEILDKGTDALQNPMVLSDLEGNVLAMSTAFLSDSSSPGWVECRETKRVPENILISPVYSEKGESVSWSEKPQIFTIDGKQKIIGDIILSDGEPIGMMAVWERKRKINPGDLWLVQIINQALVNFQKESNQKKQPFHSVTTIIENLMDGAEIEDDILNKIQLNCARPWVLEFAENAGSPNRVWQKSLLRLLYSTDIACIATIHDGYLIWLTSEKDASRLQDIVIDKREQKYFCLIRSMPFESLNMLHTRYLQIQYVFKCINGKNGFYNAEKYGLDYMMHWILSKNGNVPHTLIHPALKRLFQYDQMKGGDLYRSLYYYLLYEQSIQKAADAVHVHRNSFLYRIRRIRELTGIDTNDPKERAYLLFSYFLEDAAAGNQARDLLKQ